MSTKEEKTKCVLDDCMRLGAALGAYKESARDICPRLYLSMAAQAAFQAAQDVFIQEIHSIFSTAEVEE